MRMLCFLVLLLFFGAIGIFAMENPELITLQYFGQSVSCPPVLLIAITYLLGMVSGWAVVALVQRSLRRVTAPRAAAANIL